MKNNYRISIFKSDGNLVAFDSCCSRYQADKAFYALCSMLNQKPYKSISLSLVTPKGLERLENCEVKMADVDWKMADVDWQVCAVALNKKLDAIACRLRDSERVDEIVKDFGLDSGEYYPSVDYCELVRLDDEVGKLISSLHFVSLSSRDALLEKLRKVHSDFSMLLAFYGAFI